jgi:alkylhydroperoxidase/carboxymuconolactone decarboxylase family protein YurZ
MEERTSILICIGAATAANCIPCFEHFFGKAQEAGLTDEEIREAVDLASQVKKGAHMALRNSISKVMSQEKKYSLPCEKPTNRSCCG